MDKLRRSFRWSFGAGGQTGKKVPKGVELKPPQWLEDERKVRDSTCSFQVKYLGCVEVFESRGMHVCEEALRKLRSDKNRHQRAILYVSGEALRVVDEIRKSNYSLKSVTGLVVDQTIEKVSFCAPDRANDRGFAYICRDGTTRRWLCHGFMAIKETGERLSHAVGCAFSICLERKQSRDSANAVAVNAKQNGALKKDKTSSAATAATSTATVTTSTTTKSTTAFRPTSMADRLIDPQSAIVTACSTLKSKRPAEPPTTVATPATPDRSHRPRPNPRATAGMQSVRYNELPSTLQRRAEMTGGGQYASSDAVIGPATETTVTTESAESWLRDIFTPPPPADTALGCFSMPSTPAIHARHTANQASHFGPAMDASTASLAAALGTTGVTNGVGNTTSNGAVTNPQAPPVGLIKPPPPVQQRSISAQGHYSGAAFAASPLQPLSPPASAPVGQFSTPQLQHKTPTAGVAFPQPFATPQLNSRRHEAPPLAVQMNAGFVASQSSVASSPFHPWGVEASPAAPQRMFSTPQHRPPLLPAASPLPPAHAERSHSIDNSGGFASPQRVLGSTTTTLNALQAQKAAFGFATNGPATATSSTSEATNGPAKLEESMVKAVNMFDQNFLNRDDPFDVKWAKTPARGAAVKQTNPFLQESSSFQVKL